MKAKDIAKYLSYSDEDVIIISKEKYYKMIEIIEKYKKIKKLLDKIDKV